MERLDGKIDKSKNDMLSVLRRNYKTGMEELKASTWPMLNSAGNCVQYVIYLSKILIKKIPF